MEDKTASLAALARAGDKEAFSALYADCYRELYRFALASLRNPYDAEDVVSETVIDAFRGIAGLREDTAFKGWIYRILACKIKRKFRQYATHKENSAPPDHMIWEAQAAQEHTQLHLELSDLLKRLPDVDRMIVVLAVYDNYTSAEISHIVSINRSTVRSRLARALKKMRVMLEQTSE